jgi:hypothetical protein
MTHEEFEAFKQAWLDYPSQDNEGYIPDRGGFKCGWFAALDWVKNQKPSPTKEAHLLGVDLEKQTPYIVFNGVKFIPEVK